MTMIVYNQPDSSRNRTKWKAFSIAAGVTSLLFFGNFLGSWAFVDSKAKEWGKNLKYLDKTESQEISSPTDYRNSNPRIDTYFINNNEQTAQKERIVEQLTEIRNRAKTHFKIALDLYIWSIVAVSNVTIASVISGLCLLHIARRGWDNSNSSIMGIFIVSVGMSAISSAFIVVYQYEENIQANSDLYTIYVNLENKILTDLTANKCHSDETINVSLTTDCQQQTLGKLIVEINDYLQKLPSVGYKIDLTALPKPEEIYNSVEAAIQDREL